MYAIHASLQKIAYHTILSAECMKKLIRVYVEKP